MTRWLGAAVLLAFLGLLVWGRFYLAADREAERLQRGAVALTEALEGDAAAWERVEDAYGDAARSSVFDGYPLFVLELSHRLREGEAAGDTAEIRATTAALLTGEFELASAKAASIREERGRQWLQRLAAELLAAQRLRHPPPD